MKNFIKNMTIMQALRILAFLKKMRFKRWSHYGIVTYLIDFYGINIKDANVDYIPIDIIEEQARKVYYSAKRAKLREQRIVVKGLFIF